MYVFKISNSKNLKKKKIGDQNIEIKNGRKTKTWKMKNKILTI